MALRAHVEMKFIFAVGGAGGEAATATAHDFDFPVLRVNFCLHVYTRKIGMKAEQGNTSGHSGQRLWLKSGLDWPSCRGPSVDSNRAARWYRVAT